MDGLLINTEDLYTLALNKLLEQYHKGPLTWDIKIQLQGLPGYEAAKKVLSHYDLPISVDEYETLSGEIQESLWGSSSILPGAVELVEYFKKKNIPIALCTSSSKIKFFSKTNHLRQMFDLFDIIITGDDERILKGRGKPFPDIWELGLSQLNKKFNGSIRHDECLIFEDGLPGVMAAKAAGSYVIWVPHPEAYDVLGDTTAILGDQGELLRSLTFFNKEKFNL